MTQLRHRTAHPAHASTHLISMLSCTAAVLALALAGCSQPSPTASGPDAPATTTEAPASDAGGAAPEPSTAAADAPIGVTAPPEPPQVPDACTGEGMHAVSLGGGIDPALPEREGSTLTLSLVQVAQRDGAPAAHLTASVDGDDPRVIQPAIIGDVFTVDVWTFSVTSVCADTVEVDLID